MTGISVIKNVRTKLLTNEKLTSLIDNKIFPIVAENGTTFPFVLIKKSGINGVYSKCGIIQDNITLTIEVIDTNYANCVEIAEEIRNTIERKRFDNIVECELINGTDNYIADSYVMQLIFNVKTNNK